MNADLHCHSTASDGHYPPLEVYRLAQQAGLDLLALTDHDTVAGVAALQRVLTGREDCRLLPGIELSCRWRARTVHVVGLGIDIDSSAIREAVTAQGQVRFERARRIGDLLGRRGIHGAFDGALALAGGNAPCRPHFAEYLVSAGHCRDLDAAFKRYIGNRHITGIDRAWPQLVQALAWITAAGGVAVLAHPEVYGLTRTKLKLLVSDFRAAGGLALELPSVDRPVEQLEYCEHLCREFSLAVSVGSDFHGPVDGWRRIGHTRAIAQDLQPVWDLLPVTAAHWGGVA